MTFFVTRIKFLGQIVVGTTITSSKSQIDAILKLQPRSNKEKYQGMLNILSKYVYKMQ